MRVLLLSVLAVLAVRVGPVRADTPPTPGQRSPVPPASATSGSKTGPPVAFAVNSPLGWLVGSFCFSPYVGLGRHHALRGNLAYYNGPLVLALPATLGGANYAGAEGRFRDAGISWVVYPAGLWKGFTFEVGVLGRERNTFEGGDGADRIETSSMTYAARAMVGWTWKLGRHAFIAVAAGGSAGHETGVETITPALYYGMVMTKQIDRSKTELESYLRIGFALGGSRPAR